MLYSFLWEFSSRWPLKLDICVCSTALLLVLLSPYLSDVAGRKREPWEASKFVKPHYPESQTKGWSHGSTVYPPCLFCANTLKIQFTLEKYEVKSVLSNQYLLYFFLKTLNLIFPFTIFSVIKNGILFCFDVNNDERMLWKYQKLLHVHHLMNK